MKLSVFNSILIINGKHTLLYNSFSGKFVVVRNQLLNFSDLLTDRFSCNFPYLHKQLLDAGIIINTDIDEVALLKERINDADNNKNEYILHINPTLDCNFRCWYCYENHIPNSKMSPEVLNSTLAYIHSILKRPSIKSFELGFFGGEPLFYFNNTAKEIISYTHSLCTTHGVSLHIHFTSNGALLTNQIIQFLKQYSCGFQITLDGGKTYHDKTRFFKNGSGSYDLIVKNIFSLASSKIDVIVMVNYTSENIDSINSIFKSFKDVTDDIKKYLRFDFQRVWQDRITRTDETETKIKLIRKLFIDSGFVVLSNYIPHDVRNSCYGDKINHVLVNYNGDVFGCTARDFTSDNRIGKLDCSGNLQLDPVVVHHRNTAKYSKPICLNCRIAPICGGGCKQRALESRLSEECTFNYSDEDIDSIILDIFEYSFNLKAQ